MKQSAVYVILAATLLKTQSTEAHFKPMHLDSSLSSPIGFQQTSALSTYDQSTDLTTALTIHKTLYFLNILTSYPKLLCIVPPVWVVDILTKLSCNPTLFNAIPHHLLKGFMTSVATVPSLANAIPSTLFVSISNSLSIGSPDSTGPAVSSRPEILPTPQPVVSVGEEVDAVITPAAPLSGPAPGLPGISVSNVINASILPVAPSSKPTPGLPGISVTKDLNASISPVAPSSEPTPGLPGISVTKDLTASISPVAPSSEPTPGLIDISVMKTASITPVVPPAAPVLPADLPTSDRIPLANPPVAPSAPAVPAAPSAETSVPDVPAVGLPTLPKLPLSSLPLPSLDILSPLFNMGAGNSLLDTKIEAMLKLFASGSSKLPQFPQIPKVTHLPLHVPEVANIVSKKPTIHVNTEPDKVYILLPAPVIGKPEIPLTQATKLYYNPGLFGQIVKFLRQRVSTSSQKFTSPKINLAKHSLPKHNPSKLPTISPAVQANPIKCLPPIFSKVPC